MTSRDRDSRPLHEQFKKGDWIKVKRQGRFVNGKYVAPGYDLGRVVQLFAPSGLRVKWRDGKFGIVLADGAKRVKEA